jgi:hypothetical protein
MDKLLDDAEPLLRICRFSKKPDFIERSAAALLMHSFYNGIENILVMISKSFDSKEIQDSNVKVRQSSGDSELFFQGIHGRQRVLLQGTFRNRKHYGQERTPLYALFVGFVSTRYIIKKFFNFIFHSRYNYSPDKI